MSIQNEIHSRLWFRLAQRIHVAALVNSIWVLIQYVHRVLTVNREFFFYYPYATLWTHPRIKSRWYGKTVSPFNYSNYRLAKVTYHIQAAHTLDDGKQKIIEPNDHVLTLCLPFAATNKPSALIDAIPTTRDWLASSEVLAVTIGKHEKEMRNQFERYFGDELSTKLVEINLKRLVKGFSHQRRDDILQKCEAALGKISFVFLASSWDLKGVNLVVEAWRWADLGDAAELYIISPPPKLNPVEKLSRLPRNVTYISKSPIGPKAKKKILELCDVTIAITHVDGGANAWEGLEHGHAIITNNFHRASSLIYNNNGFSVDFPNAFYDVGRYGVEWNSISEYINLVEKMEQTGGYNDSLLELGTLMRRYVSDRTLLLHQRQRSFEICDHESLTRGNEEFSDLIKYLNQNM